MADQKVAAVAAIKEYLAHSFPGQAVEDKDCRERGGRRFTIQHHDQMLLLIVSQDFIHDADALTLRQRLEHWHLAERCLESRIGVILTKEGIFPPVES